MSAQIQNSAPIKILRRREVEARLGLSRSTIYARMRFDPARPNYYDPTFPHPVQLGGRGAAVGWIESEINDWIAAQMENAARP